MAAGLRFSLVSPVVGGRADGERPPRSEPSRSGGEAADGGDSVVRRQRLAVVAARSGGGGDGEGEEMGTDDGENGRR